MTSGKGRLKKKMATKAAAATVQSSRPLMARLATRTSACSTMASTAAFTPTNSAAIIGV